MKFLEYLYFKYYSFQVRVGNRDVAPFSSMLIIAFTFMLYYFSIFFLGILFIPQGVLNMNIFKYVSGTSNLVTFEYDSKGRLYRKYFNGITEYEQYDYDTGSGYLYRIQFTADGATTTVWQLTKGLKWRLS